MIVGENLDWGRLLASMVGEGKLGKLMSTDVRCAYGRSRSATVVKSLSDNQGFGVICDFGDTSVTVRILDSQKLLSVEGLCLNILISAKVAFLETVRQCVPAVVLINVPTGLQ